MAKVVSLAVLHGPTPTVFIADEPSTLHRLLALEVVAREHPASLPDDVVSGLRQALVEERWGAAVELWIRNNDERLDVYDSWDLVEAEDVELTGAELQFRPLFEDR